MVNSRYENILNFTLAADPGLASEDSYAAAQEILRNCGVPFPAGGCGEAQLTLQSGEYMGWVACSAAQAQEYANSGLPAVGINENRVVVIEPEDEAGIMLNKLPEERKSGNICTVSEVAPEELAQMQFFAFPDFGNAGGGIAIAAMTAPVCSHSMSTTVTPPTCTGNGTATTVCSKCGYTTTSPVSPSGHSFGSATCTSPSSCGRCGLTSGSALGHIWGSWFTVNPPSCTMSGTSLRVCSRSGHTETTPISMLEHDFSIAANCKFPATCSRCTATTGAPNPNAHVFNSPTCIHCGLTKYTVNVTANPPAGGSVGVSYFHNPINRVTVNAYPNPGFSFNGWFYSGIHVSALASWTTDVGGNITLQASFSAAAGLTEEQKMFVAVIAGEAIGANDRSRKAVAHTIMNRRNEPRDVWHRVTSVTDVLTQSGQYQALNSNQYNLAMNYLNNRDGNNELYETLIASVIPIYLGLEEDFTGGAHFIYNVHGSATLDAALHAQPSRYQRRFADNVDPDLYRMFRALW